MTQRLKNEDRAAAHVVLFDPMAAPSGYWDLVRDHLDDGVGVVRYRRHGCADLEDELPYVREVVARAGAQRVIAVGASVGGLMARRLAAVLSVAGVVLVVLARGQARWPVSRDVAVRLDAAWTAAQEGFRGLSERAVLVVAARSGHHVAQDRPDLVAAAIRCLAAPGSMTTEQLTHLASAE